MEVLTFPGVFHPQVCPGARDYPPSGGDEDMGEAGGDSRGHSQQEAGDATALAAAAADMSPNTNRHRTEGEARLPLLNTVQHGLCAAHGSAAVPARVCNRGS